MILKMLTVTMVIVFMVLSNDIVVLADWVESSESCTPGPLDYDAYLTYVKRVYEIQDDLTKAKDEKEAIKEEVEAGD